MFGLAIRNCARGVAHGSLPFRNNKLAVSRGHSGIEPIDHAEIIRLAERDAVVAQDGVSHREMKVDVRLDDLQQVVLTSKDLPRLPRQSNSALGSAGVASFFNTR